METPISLLSPRHTPGARIDALPGGWRLSIPDGTAGGYRLAQLDDYAQLMRAKFHAGHSGTLGLRARTSAAALPGTWGFGLWNDPFGLSLGFGGNPFRLPCLPNAAWFFSASPHNYLSFRNDQPAQGFLAQVFSSPRIPSPLLAPGLLAAPLLIARPLSRWIRAVIARLVREQSATLSLDPAGWHGYRLDWSPTGVTFRVDEAVVLETSVVPRGPLGLVLWIDNQFAAWRPDGSLGWGTLPNPESWLEVTEISSAR